tara:strand:- start:66579 stop:66743 length:165 start_codon:yes stop_codon:yes gene_type:complete
MMSRPFWRRLLGVRQKRVSFYESQHVMQLAVERERNKIQQNTTEATAKHEKSAG